MPPKKGSSSAVRTLKIKRTPLTSQVKRGKNIRISRASNSLTAVAAPIAESYIMTNTGPRTRPIDGGVCISHREMCLNRFLTDSSFKNLLTMYINPGIPESFPWLSVQAAQYEQYRFKSLRFEFITACPTTASGTFVMLPLYNVYDTVPSTDAQAFDCKNATEFPVWVSHSTTLDPRSLQEGGQSGRHYVRIGSVPGDLNKWDAGLFLLYSNGVTSAAGADINNAGRLIVHYEVELYTPVVLPSFVIPSSVFQSYYDISHTTAITITNGYWQQLPFFANVASNNLGAVVSSIGTGDNLLQLPPGAYLVSFSLHLFDSATAVVGDVIDFTMWVNSDGTDNNVADAIPGLHARTVVSEQNNGVAFSTDITIRGIFTVPRTGTNISSAANGAVLACWAFFSTNLLTTSTISNLNCMIQAV